MRFKEQALKKAVTFSFDDGVVQDIRMIELMNKYGLKCTFNLNSELLGGHNILIRQGLRIAHYKIAPSDVAYVYEGHEIAAHTLTHPHLRNLPENEIIRQVEEDRENLQKLAGYEIVGMAYPGGGVNNDERVAKIIRERTGVRYSRTIATTGSFGAQEDLYRYNMTAHCLQWEDLLSLGKRFIGLKSAEPAVFSVWGHSYEMDYDPRNWIRLEEFFEMISHRDDVFYGTNREVLL